MPTYEYVLGGPIVRNRLTFFTAGRFQNQEAARNTVNPVNFPYVFEDQRKRYEIKLTGSVTSNHRFEGSYQKEAATQVNHTFSTTTSMDSASLYTRETPLDAYQVSYNGILSNQLFVEARFSARKFSFIGSGAQTTDLIDGTLLLDGARGNLRYWSPTLCGVCGRGREDRDNDNEYVKATYFKSTKGVGTHTVVFGFDSFNDKRFVDAHQSGSDYRIIGTTSIVRTADANCGTSPGCIFPQFLPGLRPPSSSIRSRSGAWARTSAPMHCSSTTICAGTTTSPSISACAGTRTTERTVRGPWLRATANWRRASAWSGIRKVMATG